jgi:rare lipoprotein A
MRRCYRQFIILAAVLTASACTIAPLEQSAEQPASTEPERATPVQPEEAPVSEPNADPAVRIVAATQTGFASWYGKSFKGRKTASGERFDPNALTAAHRTFPFGSWVRVTVAGTSRSVIVRINDRGPFARNRIIDLSYGAAAALGVVHGGTVRVELVRVDARSAA